MRSNLEPTEDAAVPFDIDLQSSLAWHRGAIFGRKAAEEEIARLVEQARLREIDYQNLLLEDVDTGGATCGDADATHRILYEYNRAERERARADDAEARSDTFDTEYRRSLLARALAAEAQTKNAWSVSADAESDLGDWVRRAVKAEAQVAAVRVLLTNPAAVMHVYRDPCEIPAVGVYDIETALDGWAIEAGCASIEPDDDRLTGA